MQGKICYVLRWYISRYIILMVCGTYLAGCNWEKEKGIEWDDWAQLIRQVGKQMPFVVRELTQDNILDFPSVLKANFHQHKEDLGETLFVWKQGKYLHYREEESVMVFYKTSEDDEEPFRTVSFKRKGKNAECVSSQVKYKEPNLISDKRKTDLQFTSPVFHHFCGVLRTSRKIGITYSYYVDSEITTRHDHTDTWCVSTKLIYLAWAKVA